MAEDGITDYGAAKRKAARQLGAADGDALPSNEEVEIELRDYQAIFQDDEQHERLKQLRTEALEVMNLLADFHPCLTGAVLDGTAGRYAGIELDIFADSSKDVDMLLLSRGINYTVDEMRRQGPFAAETRVRLDWNGETVTLMIYPPTAERSRPRQTVPGRLPSRARAPAVAALLATPAS